MAEMVKHEAAVACYGRWDDADKKWEDASVLLGAHVKAAVVADVIVDTPEEIEALPDDQEVVVPEKNVMGPVIKDDKTVAKDKTKTENVKDPVADPSTATETKDPSTEAPVDPETTE